MCLYQVIITLHFLNDIVNMKIDDCVIIASLISESACKLINRIPGLRLLIPCLPGSALRTHVESLCKPRGSTSILKTLPGKFDIKRHSPSIFYFLAVIIISGHGSP